MNLSPEGQKLFNKLISEMLEDGFVKISDYTFYKKLGSMTVSLGDHADASGEMLRHYSRA